MTSQTVKHERFKALHDGAAFVMPNAWDAGTARALVSRGFEALGTTSAGYAITVAKRDSAGRLTREEILGNARVVARSVEVPVSGDLENGFGDAPADCADTVRLALEAGLVGGSIEDATGRPDDPIYPLEVAVERVRAAAEASVDRPFLLTARAENFLFDRPDLADTITRLRAFEAAGADVLYAPGLPDLEAIQAVCAKLSKPVNVVMGLSGAAFDLATLEAAGVRRVSTGGAIARFAFAAVLRAAEEIRDRGSFEFAAEAIADREVGAVLTHRGVRP